jgi:glycosyltransferase involved in cell wall biosynthesis
MTNLIAIDARSSGTSTGRYVDKLIEYIAKIDPDYDFNIIAYSDRVGFMKKIAPKYTVYETKVPLLGFKEQTDLLREINEIDADLVHFAMIQQPVLYRGKVVTTMHDLTMAKPEFRNPRTNVVVFYIKMVVYKWINKIGAKKSAFIITGTEYIKKEVMGFTKQPDKKFVVTYESADKIKEKADPYKKLVGKKFLMYIGRPWPHKNLNRLIDAFQILQDKHPDLYLALAGVKNDNYVDIEKRVNSQGIKNIIFTDFVTEGQLRWLYENCAVYVFPSLSEGFGLPGLEAMVHGAPVVSSNATCLPEVYGDAAMYFNPRDTDNMAGVINTVLSDEKLREEMIKKGFAQAAKYSWQRMAEQTLAVYDRALKS